MDVRGILGSTNLALVLGVASSRSNAGLVGRSRGRLLRRPRGARRRARGDHGAQGQPQGQLDGIWLGQRGPSCRLGRRNVEKNVYIGTNFVEQSRFRFSGEAKIDKDWSAGYILEIGSRVSPSNQWNQLSPNSANLNPSNGDNGLIVRKSNWFIKSKTFGQVAVGQNGTATYHLLDDADPLLTRNVDDAEGAAIFCPRSILRGFNNSNSRLTIGRRNVVRYDSPNVPWLYRYRRMGRGRPLGYRPDLQERHRRLPRLGPRRLR